MNFKKIVGLAATTLALNMGMFGDANAASVGVDCEVRGLNRSKISVNGASLRAGQYRAYAKSGANVKWSKAFQRPVNGQVEFDFDSDPGDIRAGATAIIKTFIQNRAVTGSIYKYNSTVPHYTLAATIADSCAAK